MTIVAGRRGMVVAPHGDAAESGARILREGGNAIEAMLAMAATIAVVYPHMNGIGGDGFWLISVPGSPPIGIQACGPAAAGATLESYRDKGLVELPPRGGDAALTVAGTIAGWRLALATSEQHGGRLPLQRLLADAIDHAGRGVAVTASHAQLAAEKLDGLRHAPG